MRPVGALGGRHDAAGMPDKQNKSRGEKSKKKTDFFNGEQWADVNLPDEVRHAKETEILLPQALTSDRVLFTFQDTEAEPDEPVALYQILLNTDSPTLEYLGTIG